MLSLSGVKRKNGRNTLVQKEVAANGHWMKHANMVAWTDATDAFFGL